ncbi:hypothetical protein, partial [Streptomyces sp. SID3343]|uniref:hypothetical protein n=1 Tax=Streptomyces sp. SID3343 TaxID=2690260 RepID=UPI001F30F2DF
MADHASVRGEHADREWPRATSGIDPGRRSRFVDGASEHDTVRAPTRAAAPARAPAGHPRVLAQSTARRP